MGVKLAIQTAFTALDRMSPAVTTMGRNVDRFSRNASRSGMNIGTAWGKLRGIVGAVGASISIAAVGKAIGDFAERGDDIDRLSKTLGLTTTQFQKLGYVGKMFDVTQEDITASMKKLNANLAQLNAGEGTMMELTKHGQSGLAAQLKTTHNASEAFYVIADAIRNTKDAQVRAMIAQAAFGKSGQQLIPALLEGGDALRKMGDEAERSGKLMTDQAIKAASELDDSLKQLKISGTGLLNNVLSRLVPALVPLIDKFSEWVSKNGELIGQKVEATIDAIGRAAKFAYDIWTNWSPVILTVVGGMLAFNVAMKAAMIIQTISKAISVTTAVMAMFRAGASVATVAQWLFNAALMANPIGLIVVGIAALIAIVAMMVKHWDKVGPVLEKVGRGFMTFILAPINLVLTGIRALLGILASLPGKAGGAFKGALDAVASFQDKMNNAVTLTGPGAGGQATPVSPNTGTIAAVSGGGGTWNGRLDITGAPPGSVYKSTGTAAPAVTVNAWSTMRALQ